MLNRGRLFYVRAREQPRHGESTIPTHAAEAFAASCSVDWLDNGAAPPPSVGFNVNGDEIAGYAAATISADGGFVDDLAVRRPWRRRGLGSALLLAEFRNQFADGRL